MSIQYRPYAGLAPSASDNAYILALVPIEGNNLAAITSAGELLVVDRQDLTTAKLFTYRDVPNGVNCLTAGDPHGQTLLCSGVDGTIVTFDVRSQKRVSSFKLDRIATALHSDGVSIVVGTEFKSQHAVVSIWDARQNRQLWQNAENNDEVTVVGLHPSRRNVVLAGSDDGLVSLFDTNITEEEDSLMQVINHGPIHKAGFLGENRIYALSSDQNFAVHPVSTPRDDEDPEPTLFGDLRPLIPCQYVVDVFRSGQDYVIATATNIGDSHLDLVKLAHATDANATPNLDQTSKVNIEPAHGEEIVRALFVDDEAGVVFTAGEDGFIRASRPSNTSTATSSAAKSSSKQKKHIDNRYKPY